MLSSSTFALADSENFKDKILFQGNVSSQEKERVTREIQEYIKLTGQELRDAGQWKVVYGSPKTIKKVVTVEINGQMERGLIKVEVLSLLLGLAQK